MANSSVRNPLAGFLLAILSSTALSAIAGYFGTWVPYLEFRLFAVGFGLFAIGCFAGRKTYMGSLGFVGTYLGAFVGFYLSEQLFWIPPIYPAEPLALAFALAAGAGGFLMGKVGVHRLDRMQRIRPALRRCSACGARVGESAHKCWSCKATLTY